MENPDKHIESSIERIESLRGAELLALVEKTFGGPVTLQTLINSQVIGLERPLASIEWRAVTNDKHMPRPRNVPKVVAAYGSDCLEAVFRVYLLSVL